MTKIIHSFKKEKIKKEGDSDCFILTNGIGSYASFSNKPISKYQGIIFNKDFEVFKTVDDIKLLGAPPVDTVINSLDQITRIRGHIKEHFLMPKDRNSLIYWLEENHTVRLSFDCRKLFDMREWGKSYAIYEEEGKIIIEYNKQNDSRDHSAHSSEQYKTFIVIAADTDNYNKIGKWREERYKFDEDRGFIDKGKRHIYDALSLNCKTLVFGFSTNKDEAIGEVNYVLEHFSGVKKRELNVISDRRIHKEINMAYICSQNSLNQLVQNISNVIGVYGGIWWFCQYWTRDTSVSLKALMLDKKYDIVKDILFDYLNRLEKDGRILNRIPRSNLASVDGVGWVFKRLGDLIEILEKERKLKKYISDEDIKLAKKKLKKAVNDLVKFHTKDDLAINAKDETWMDTSAETYDFREGARIEIQALRLNMYKLLKKLGKMTKDDRTFGEAKKLEEAMFKKVKKVFWNGKYLNDGKGDKTIRPNIFLAYYIYPELLDDKEWTDCFDNVLPALWCDWGGLSSIDKKDKLFTPKHTGENNRSYHRGDSWYWINNIAALCMNKLDKEKYSVYITDILDASTIEILWKGCVGCHAEISSAKDQESWGCLDQAWSNATFIELIDEIFR